jgi:6,7-dimethyl-8-ribityllumazine synthase
MATELQNSSGSAFENVPDASGMRFAVVVSEWNSDITGKLRDGVVETLQKQGVKPENIQVVSVPGSFELIYGVKIMAESMQPDAVIGLGCVVRGDTPHFDYVCAGVTQGFAALNAEGNIPYIFGLLTTDNIQQSIDRAGGKYGNKGNEYAITAIKMANIRNLFK